MSAPLKSGTLINMMAPIIAMISAPKNALPNPLTVKFGTSAAASIIIKALITSANKPKVTTESGAVKNHSAGRRNTFISPSVAAAIKKARKFLALMPGIIKMAKPSPMAVASQVTKIVVSNMRVSSPEKRLCQLFDVYY